jgi:hypothetical protein
VNHDVGVNLAPSDANRHAEIVARIHGRNVEGCPYHRDGGPVAMALSLNPPI